MEHPERYPLALAQASGELIEASGKVRDAARFLPVPGLRADLEAWTKAVDRFAFETLQAIAQGRDDHAA